MSTIIKVKHKTLNGKVYISKFLRGATIIVGIPCLTLDSIVLNNINKKICEEDKGVLYKHSEVTALFYALYAEIKYRVMAPAQMKSSAIHDVYCNHHNGYFNLVFVTTNGTGTAVKKILTEAFKWLNPAKLKASYKRILTELGLKSHEDEFRWAVNQVNDCLKKELLVMIIGRINFGKTASDRSAKLNQILTSTHVKFKSGNSMTKLSGGKSPESLKNLGYSLPVTTHAIIVSGINAYYLQKYIDHLTRGSIHTEILGGKLIVHSNKYSTLLTAMKNTDKLNAYIKGKYGKKSILLAITGMVLIEAALCGVDAKSLFNLSDNVKPADIKSGIKSALSKA